MIYDEEFVEDAHSLGYPYHKALNKRSIELLARTLMSKGWNISEENIRNGFERFEEISGLKGRFQSIANDPITIVDVSHNVDGLNILFDEVSKLVKEQAGKLYLIFGTVKDKDLASLFKLFPKDAKKFWTQSSVPRALSVNELAIQAVMHGLQGECFKDVNEAIKEATTKAKPNDVVLITGSTFVVADIDKI